MLKNHDKFLFNIWILIGIFNIFIRVVLVRLRRVLEKKTHCFATHFKNLLKIFRSKKIILWHVRFIWSMVQRFFFSLSRWHFFEAFKCIINEKCAFEVNNLCFFCVGCREKEVGFFWFRFWLRWTQGWQRTIISVSDKTDATSFYASWKSP